MPNHVTNKLVINTEGDELKRIKKKILGKDKDGKLWFDFNRLIKMPKAMNRTSPFQAETPKEKGMNTEELEEYRKGLVKKYGADTWYDWSVKYWGTKWNSYHNHICGNEIIFDTAWSPPDPVIMQLSKLFPEVEFDFWYIDEGWGFAGCTAYKEGVLIDENPIECSEDNGVFCQLCEELIGYDPDS